jgi:hypothetical protein
MKEPKAHITLKRVLLITLVLALWMPFLQKTFLHLPEKELKGAFSKGEKVGLNIKSWADGSYQDAMEEYQKNNYGFSTYLVRLYNQIYFSLFRETNAFVVIGKEDCLYEENYIKAYYGLDFVGDSLIETKVKKLAEIQAGLAQKGKHLLVVMAPGKASFFPEFIPDTYTKADGPTNYQRYKHYLNNYHIQLLDFNQWFTQAKDSSRYPLYSTSGVHWSVYGYTMAADSILSYLSQSSGENLPKLTWEGIEIDKKARFTDQDAEESLNLIFNLPDGDKAYPKYSFTTDSSTACWNAITIADSYWWSFFGTDLARGMFEENEFWYYFQEDYSFSRPMQAIEDVDIATQVEQSDVIILLSTDANLYKFAFGAIDELHLLIKHPEVYFGQFKEKENRINEIIASMRNTPEWLELIKEKAQNKNISVEEALRADAEYMYMKEEEKKN